MAVLYLSGYPSSAIGQYEGLTGAAAFLQKPFRLNELLEKVREILDERKRHRGEEVD